MMVAFNDDAGSLDSRIDFSVPDRRHVLRRRGRVPDLPDDPFDSGSGDGVGSEGPYNVTITAGEDDVDVYAVRLRKGDVLGALGRGRGDADHAATTRPAPR